MTYRILSQNPTKFRIDDCLRDKNGLIHWVKRQHLNGLKPGDILFIYSSSTEQYIKYIMRVEDVDGESTIENQFDENQYWNNDEDIPQVPYNYCTFRLIQQLNEDVISSTDLRRQNIKGPQGTRILEGDDLNFFACKIGNELARKIGINPQNNDNNQPEQPNTPGTEGSVQNVPNVKFPLNQILYGPPGTGKTYHTVNKALDIIDGKFSKEREENRKRFDELVKEGQIQFITFHQSMSYEDFIEGIKPETEAETKIEKKEAGLKYKKVDGIFKKIALEAAKDENKSKNYVLIIDEINRGNIAEIFGELITLIEEDKRMGNAEAMQATLPYTHEKFGVPNNLYIIGTMNTADRSVESLDTALRRRFSFEEMMPDYTLLDENLRKFLGDDTVPDVTLGNMLAMINRRIRGLKDREHQIGHAYFMSYPDGTENRKEWLKNVFKNKVVPLLQEYFYGDFKQIAAVLGPSFVTKEIYTSNVFVNTPDFEFDEVTKYDVRSKEGWEDLDICEALQNML